MAKPILTVDDIPPEDMTLCNDAEGCDDCQWSNVCFAEEGDWVEGTVEEFLNDIGA